MRATSEIKETVIKELCADGVGPGKIVIRIVSWNDLPPVVEKRQYILDKDTRQLRTGKNKGLRAGELEMLVERWPEIRKIMAEYDPEWEPKADVKTSGKKK